MNNNNRNNRRRGRGNRSQGGGNGSQLNRIDSRARGNAPQMLDKYKKLAQDAQHNGDRVQMEYYLQFADHYFRVIADNKARQDEQRGPGAQGRRNDERDQNDDYGDDDLDFDRGRRSEQASRPRYDDQHNSARTDMEEGEPGQEGEPFLTDDRDDDRSERQPRQQEARRQPRKTRDSNRDGNRSERPARAEWPERTERPVPAAQDDSAEPARSEKRAEKPAPRPRRPRKAADDAPAGLDSSILPPSIRGDDAGGDSGALETVD